MANSTPDEAFFKQHVASVTFDGMSDKEMLEGYRQWADTYDQEIVCGAKSIGHVLVAKSLGECFPPEIRPTVKIIDIGAGTGHVGEELQKAGFQNIDALDPSKEMLAKARGKHVYTNVYEEFITDEKLDIPENSYDGLVGSGIFAEVGHVPTCALKEMVRLVKPGGYIVMVTREGLLSMKKDLEPFMDELEAQGKWKKIDRVVGPNMYLDRRAITWKYQVL